MSERKATDILLDLENSVLELKRKIDSQDLVLKAMLVKINEFTKGEQKQKKQTISSPRIEVAQESIIVVPEQPPSLLVNPQEEFKEVDESSLNEKKYTVTQRVVDEMNKTIFLAAVDVIDLNTKEKVCRETTKSNGKFKLSLPAGNYRLKISKQKNLQSVRLESMQDIVVVGDINLPDFILK